MPEKQFNIQKRKQLDLIELEKSKLQGKLADRMISYEMPQSAAKQLEATNWNDYDEFASLAARGGNIPSALAFSSEAGRIRGWNACLSEYIPFHDAQNRILRHFDVLCSHAFGLKLGQVRDATAKLLYKQRFDLLISDAAVELKRLTPRHIQEKHAFQETMRIASEYIDAIHDLWGYSWESLSKDDIGKKGDNGAALIAASEQNMNAAELFATIDAAMKQRGRKQGKSLPYTQVAANLIAEVEAEKRTNPETGKHYDHADIGKVIRSRLLERKEGAQKAQQYNLPISEYEPLTAEESKILNIIRNKDDRKLGQQISSWAQY